MASPVEIVGAPYTIYVADVGESFPAIGSAPAGNWVKLGANGADNYDDPGVTVTHGQSLEHFRGAAVSGPQKSWRPEEDQLIEFALADLTVEQYAKVLDDATVTTDAGPPAEKYFSTYRGIVVKEYALLAIGVSAHDAAEPAHYEVARCVQAGEPAPQHHKGGPGMLACQFMAHYDQTDGFGTVRHKTG